MEAHNKLDNECPTSICETNMDIFLQDPFDSMLCIPGSRLVQYGFKNVDCKDECLIFINAGGHHIQAQDSNVNFEGDTNFEGGDVIGTDVPIIEGGDYPSLYQTARFGDFSYKINGLSPGEYFVDFHFAEIVNIAGPKGIRVFDVFMQDEKVLSEVDIYALVGANKPLQIVDVRVSVGGAYEALVIKFQGNNPILSGLCIRRAPNLTPAAVVSSETVVCIKCATEIETSPFVNRARSMKITEKYEKKLEELTNQCKLKSDECYQAWLALTATNDELEKLRMEHDAKLFQTETLEQVIEQQADKLRRITDQYEHDKKLWLAAIKDLDEKIKALKQEHCNIAQEAHECASSIPDMNKMIDAVQAMVAQCEDLKVKYNDEIAKRKRLYNLVQEAKGNIRVFCRCRPLSKEEAASGYANIVDFEGAKDGDIGIVNRDSSKKIYKFDRVFTPKDNQEDVYADASPLVTSVLDGYNVCIFAYGQTGTGKTFTMEGSEHSRGVNYRTLEELFNIANEKKETFNYSISVSVLEVYNEQIRDLLATSPSSKKLEVRQGSQGNHNVPGIVEAKVENIKEVWDVLKAGSNARAVGSNNINEHSSRSHCMLCIMVKSKNLISGECTNSKLWLVDLAGSERLAKTDAQGERLKEAQNINRSLSALGDVISALATKNSHIPYRNSKLTHLLQDSLGGDSKALMFVQISPSENDLSETTSSLNFASRVRGIELGPARKQIDNGEIQKTKQMLEKARQELRTKDESLRKYEENCQNLESKFKGREQQFKSLQEKNKELENQLESKVQLQEKQNWQLSDKLKAKEELCLALQQRIRELEHRLKDQQHSESIILQQKNKELECKLKEQMQSEQVASQKVKELEFKLQDQWDKFESMLQQKIKELEQKQKEERMVTPAPSRDEVMTDVDPQILRSSNSNINRQTMNCSSPMVSLKRRESLHEVKRKREFENNNTSLAEKKMNVSSEPSRTRKVVDVTRAHGRINRQAKGVLPTQQRLMPQGRIAKDDGNKETDRSKTRGWVR